MEQKKIDGGKEKCLTEEASQVSKHVAARVHNITSQDFCGISRPGEFRLSSDNMLVAFVKHVDLLGDYYNYEGI